MEKKKATLIKVFPVKRQINSDLEYDSLIIFYRDENGEKKTRFINRAIVPFYILKDKESEEAISPPMFIEAEKVSKIETFSDSLFHEIATRTGALSYYDLCANSGTKASKSNLKNLLKHNLIYDADMDVTDRYISNFMEEFDPDPSYKLHKTYMDIEVDLLEHGLDKPGFIGFPSEDIAPCPVNIITLIDGKFHKSYTFAYDNGINKSQQEFIKMYKANPEAYKESLKKKIKERNNIEIEEVSINFYYSETATIEAFFSKIHEINPDICASWNQVFDVTTLINRLKKLYGKDATLKSKGINPNEKLLQTVCDIKYCTLKDESGRVYYIDPVAYYKARKDKTYVDRIDEFTVLDGIFWADSMLFYANIRKSNGVKENYSLDAIAEEELGSEKLDYEGYTIENLPWKNYQLFLEYNIFDVVLLDALERKNLDFDMIQKLCEVTCTRKYKVFKKTVSLKNFISKFAQKQGYVMNNNKNARYGDGSEYFKENYLHENPLRENSEEYKKLFEKKENFGAYVGNPLLNNPEGIPDYGGHPSEFIFEDVFDEDFSSLYPSIIRAFNLSPTTSVGKFFLIDDKIKQRLINFFDYDGLFAVSKNEEGDADGNVSTSDLGPTLVDSLMSQDWNDIGEKFFMLPNTEKIIEDLKVLADSKKS